MSAISRRAFLRHAASLSALGTAAPLGLSLSAIGMGAAQASQSNYKALVCIFLYGGNDAYNTLLCNDSASWTDYNNHRNPATRSFSDNSTSLALMPLGTPPAPQAILGSPSRLGGVLSLELGANGLNAGRSVALHPLLPDVAQLYGQGRLAALANVGPLTQALDAAQYAGALTPRPAKLFSHNDQQSTWQSFSPEGAGSGWGGRMGDLLMSRNGLSMGALTPLVQQSLTCISPTGNGLWLTGDQSRALQVGNESIASLGQAANWMGQASLQADLVSMMTTGGNNLFALDHQAIAQRAVNAQSLLGSVLPAQAQAPWGTPGIGSAWQDPLMSYTSPLSETARTNPLAIQLQMVARLIEANRSGQLGLQRQVFMVSLGGFDTHGSQNQEHADRMAQLNHALAYFDTALGQMPGGDMRSQVTTFTASDFGRSLTNNGDGTDHGWGGHHFIMGGAVQGGSVYGKLPQYATADGSGHFDSPDLIDNGAMLPSTSVDQYAYTLGRWMDVPDTELRGILPNLANFDTGTHNLGFMG